jgi:hypothetical protein
VRVLATALVGLAPLSGCNSDNGSKPAIIDSIVLTRDDGSRIEVDGPISVTCGPAGGDGPRALRVIAGARAPGTPRAYWVAEVGLADLKQKRTFRFPQDDVGGYALFFALDAQRMENELSSSEEEATGRITFRKADCRRGVDFRIDAYLGSEFFQQPGADVRGRFAAPAS